MDFVDIDCSFSTQNASLLGEDTSELHQPLPLLKCFSENLRYLVVLCNCFSHGDQHENRCLTTLIVIMYPSVSTTRVYPFTTLASILPSIHRSIYIPRIRHISKPAISEEEKPLEIMETRPFFFIETLRKSSEKLFNPRQKHFKNYLSGNDLEFYWQSEQEIDSGKSNCY